MLVAGTASAQQIAEENILDAEVEPVARYAIEVILFTYGSSVTAGTEVFLPVEAPAAASDELATVFGEAPEFGDAASRSAALNADTDELMAAQPGTLATNPDDSEDLVDDRELASADGVSSDPGMPLAGSAANGDSGIPGDDPDGSLMAADLLLDVDLTQPLEPVITNAASIEYTPLVDDQLTLADAHERLLRLDAYTPVLWAGWTQIVREQAESPTLDLRRLGNLPLSMSGELKLYLGRFVHLDVDITLEESIVVSTPEAADFGYGYNDRGFERYDGFGPRGGRPVASKIEYRIDDDRIMRNGETRYFDHPRFGLVARLTLVEEPEPGAENPALLPDLLPGNVDPQQ